MRRPHTPSVLVLLGAVLALAPRARAQEQLPADTLAVPDSLLPPPPVVPLAGLDPRLTWLGDTLHSTDPTLPKFSTLPEAWPDSMVRIYTPVRPGAEPAWRMTGSAFLGRGAYNMLDVLESEFPVLAQDLGGSGLPAFLGSAHGTGTGVQVVIDGVPAGSALMAAWDLRQIPLEALADVAWYPGPQVAAFGGGGTAGVLEITTRRSLGPGARSMIAFLLGSFEAQAFSGFFGRPVTERGDFFLGANFDAIEGGAASGDFTRNQSVVRAGWQLGERHRVEISRRGDGIAGRENRVDVRGREDFDTAAVHGFYRGGFGPVTARLHAQRERAEITEALLLAGSEQLLGRGEKTDLRGDLEARLGERARVWAAAARVEEEPQSTSVAFFVNEVDLLDPDAPDDVRIAPRTALEIAGGGGFGGPADPFAGNVAVRRVAFDERLEGGVSWQAEALARPLEGLTLRAAGGRAVRPPDFVSHAVLQRQAILTGEIHPGRAADPEALEAWTEWRGEADWRRDRWRAAGRAWRATGEGAFLWLPSSAWLRFDPTSTAFRIGEVGLNTFDVVDMTITGLEGEIRLPLPYHVDGILRARWLDETIDDLDARVPYVPEFQALGQLRWAQRLFPSRDLLVETRLTGRYVGSRPTLTGGDLPGALAGDFLVQATVVSLTVYVSVKNFTGTALRSEEGFAVPGAEGFLGINWRFRN